MCALLLPWVQCLAAFLALGLGCEASAFDSESLVQTRAAGRYKPVLVTNGAFLPRPCSVPRDKLPGMANLWTLRRRWADQRTQEPIQPPIEKKQPKKSWSVDNVAPWGQTDSDERKQSGSLLQVLGEIPPEVIAWGAGRAWARESGRPPPGYRMCAGAADNLYSLKPLLIPSKKLAFCFVPKVACTQMKILFNSINGLVDEQHTSERLSGKNYLKSTYRTFGIDPKNVSRANGWKFAMFLQDPALRYLSAYSSACMKNTNGIVEHPMDCCGDVAGAKDSKEEVVDSFAERVRNDAFDGIPYMDMHWSTQADHVRQCGYENFGPENLDYVGYLAGNVNGQVKEMLGLVNISNDTLVDRLFPPGGVAGPHSGSVAEASAFYNDSDVLEAVKSLYAEDYKMFPQVGCAFSYRSAQDSSLKL